MMMDNWAVAEFADARIKDARRRRSLVKCAQRLCERRGVSFSAAVGHDGRQAMWRLFGDHEVSVEDMLAGHVQQLAERAKAYEMVISAGDTTPTDYQGHTSKTELGPHNGGAGEHCLLIHSQYVLSLDGTPLGVAGMQMWTRDRASVGKAKDRKQRPPEEKESRKWLQGMRRVEEVMPPEVRVLLIHDAESDVGDFLAAPRRTSSELLVRAAQDRCVWVDGVKRKLFEVAASAPLVELLTVTVPRRPGQPARQAVLTVRQTWVRLPQSGSRRESGDLYRVVRAAEENPPEGLKEPICWVLLTTLDETLEPLPSTLVRYYTLRWRIESWHHVLKSGMQIERLQIERLEPLKKALCLLGVVAWQVMYLTHLGREHPELPAEELLDEVELQVLRADAKAPVVTVADAAREIARLAGYQPYRSAPPPGVKMLWIGRSMLAARCAGWRLAAREQAGEI